VDFLRWACKLRMLSIGWNTAYEGPRRFEISAAATRADTLRLSRSVARERMRQIKIGSSSPIGSKPSERDRAATEGRTMIETSVRGAPIERLSDQWERHAGGRTLLWRGPRSTLSRASARLEAMERALSPQADRRDAGRSSYRTYRQQAAAQVAGPSHPRRSQTFLCQL